LIILLVNSISEKINEEDDNNLNYASDLENKNSEPS